METLIYIAAALVLLYLNIYFQEQYARRTQLGKAPTFRQLAFESAQTDFRQIPLNDRWRDQPVTNFDEPPTMMLASSNMQCHVWRSAEPNTVPAVTLIVWWKGLEFPWTITFLDRNLVLASIGGPQGARFRGKEFPLEEQRSLQQFFENVLRRLGVAD